MTPRCALWALIAATTLLRLAWAASLGVGNDEAYYYLFTVHPDWSYFDHPPMTALVEAAGLAFSSGEPTALGLRLGFVLLFAGSTWLMARLTMRFYGPWAGLVAATVFNASAYFGAAAGAFALPDGPLIFFWLLALDRLAAALTSPRRLLPWLGVGLAWGGALLSKYHGVFLPIGAACYLLAEPGARHWLRRPGPYLAGALALLMFAPVIGWNATHDWASFAFQGGRALGGLRFRPDYLATAVLGQVLYALPWIWLALMGVLFRTIRCRRTSAGAADRFLLVQAVVPLGAFLLVACQQTVLPHWALAGLLPIFPMLGRDWLEHLRAEPRRLRRRLIGTVAPTILIALAFLVQARTGLLQEGGSGTLGLLAVSRDPTLDTFGWEAIADELERRGLVGDPGTFVFTSKWYHSGQLAFATGAKCPILCYSARKPLGFAQWSRPEQWVGHDGILVVVNHSSTEPAAFDRWFERIDWLGNFEIQRAGAAVKRVRLYRCVRQTEPFPYAPLEPEVGTDPTLVAGRPSPIEARRR